MEAIIYLASFVRLVIVSAPSLRFSLLQAVVMERQNPRPPESKFAREVFRIGRKAKRLAKPLLTPLFRRAIRRPLSVDLGPIRNLYEQSPMAAEPETFCLLRIIGNDLTPRHRKGQSRDNVAFTLEREASLEGCSKHWILNRIFDAEEEAAIIDLLEQHQQSYHCIPFDLAVYAQQPWDIDCLAELGRVSLKDGDKALSREKLNVAALSRRTKSNYAINNNGARNFALDLGRSMAKWVLPWDGNCFVTEAAWKSIREGIAERPYIPYFVVPMARITDNAMLLKAHYRPNAIEEPQIIFRRDAQEKFDERFPYGHRPKVEFLWRLGVPGVWDDFVVQDYDLPRPTLCSEAGQYGQAGWVARLNSGNPTLEVGRKSSKRRGAARDEAIVAFLDMLDQACVEANLLPPDNVPLPRRTSVAAS